MITMSEMIGLRYLLIHDFDMMMMVSVEYNNREKTKGVPRNKNN